MGDSGFEKRISDLKERLERLPEHDSKAIEAAARRLEAYQADFTLAGIDIDLLRSTRSDVRRTAEELAEMSFKELRDRPGIEPDFEGGDEKVWTESARLNRISRLLESFELLSRLRDDDPEAWDEIETLYYDD